MNFTCPAHLKPIPVIVLLLLTSFVAISQESDSVAFVKRALSRYEITEDESIYSLMNRMRTADKQSYYLTFAKTYQQTTPDPEFRTADGELPNSILEMRLADRFNVIHWDEKVAKDFWIRANFLTVNFDFLYRIGKRSDPNVTDNPGHPLNTIFGFTLYEQAFFFNKDKWSDYRKPKGENLYGENKYNAFSTNNLGTRIFSKKNLNFWTLKIDLMHFSNGQDTGAVVFNQPMTSFRNNYINGNFSTNYAKLHWQYHETNAKGQYFSAGMAYRRDFPMGKVFSYESWQEDRYGYNFINLDFQFRTGPVKFLWDVRDVVTVEQKQELKKAKKFYKQLDPTDSTSLQQQYLEIIEAEKELQEIKYLPGLWEFAFKLKAMYIPDKITPGEFANKVGLDLQIEAIPLFSPQWSFFVGAYYGRDYLNIRYDLPVVIVKGLVSFQISRYRPSSDSMIKKFR